MQNGLVMAGAPGIPRTMLAAPPALRDEAAVADRESFDEPPAPSP